MTVCVSVSCVGMVCWLGVVCSGLGVLERAERALCGRLMCVDVIWRVVSTIHRCAVSDVCLGVNVMCVACVDIGVCLVMYTLTPYLNIINDMRFKVAKYNYLYALPLV